MTAQATPDPVIHTIGDAATMPRLRSGRAGPLMVAVALLAGLVTFLLVTGLAPIAPTHQVVL
uniref:hypothetical protein n=1 Tax=Stenotrophomonas maltophilia TaxID=40324 RepID=UPI0013DB1837